MIIRKLRLRLLASIGSVMALTLVTGFGTAALADQTSRPGRPLRLTTALQDHGVVATARNVRTSAVGVRADGTPLLYALSDGNPVSFNVLNADTGALIGEFPLPPKSIGSSPTVAEDGTAYFGVRDGKSTLIHRYDPGTNKVNFVTESPTGDAVTRALRIADDGKLYGSTYPNAKAFSYDLASGEVRDFGRVTDGSDTYGWGFEKVDETLYVGTGIGEGHAVAVDIATGTKTELELPEAQDDQLTYFYAFRKVGDLVAMAFSPGMPEAGNTLFWDTVNKKWACDGAIDTFLSLNGPFTESTPDGKLFYKSNDEIWSFDSTDCSVKATGWKDSGLGDTGSHRTLGLVNLGADDQPLLIGANNDGSFWRFDPDTGEHQFFDNVLSGAPLTTHSINAGPDGRVYTGTYLGPGSLGRFDPDTGEKTTLTGPGQVDSMINLGDEMLLGSYPNAVVHRGDPALPWKFGTNPAKEFELIGSGQDRIVQMATDGQRLALGTVADYGITGGALTVVDAEGNRTVHRDLVKQQSVTSVTWGKDGLIYAGTSIRGGLSSPTSPGDAELIVFDPESNGMLFHGVPVPDNDVVAGVAQATDGVVWGLTNTGKLFGFDTEKQSFAMTVDLGVGSSPSPWGLASTLQLNPKDGLLYGLAGKRVFAFDPISHRFQFLSEHEFKRLTIDPAGTLFAIDETHLFELTVERRGR